MLISMPISVFISDRQSAPAPSQALAIFVMSVTFGLSLTITGLLVEFFAALVTAAA